MIYPIKKESGDHEVVAVGRSPTVYLDNNAIIGLADNVELQNRFVSALLNKEGTFYISLANVIEIGRKSGPSLIRIRDFFSRIGPNWFPLESNAVKVMERETSINEYSPCFDAEFLSSYYPYIHEGTLSLEKVIDLLDGRKNQCDSLHQKADGLARSLLQNRTLIRQKHPSINPDYYKVEGFDENKPIYYVYNRLMRTMLEQDFMIEANDIYDIWHAATSLAYADFVILDKHWCQIAKDKLKKLPRLSEKVFRVSELKNFVDIFERVQVVA